eukprot:TRINITY_DN75508_c0_g1_i1.p1 TRINITY_DN75508_c0_g1~~TRINITY_DN75508_c0_g1_i1.p1  ORF type:complete len:184 (-),score=55.82 TRINITY_DN75508_c0_g1_i1:111-662(-)
MSVGAIVAVIRKKEATRGSSYKLNETEKVVLKYDKNMDNKLQRDELKKALTDRSKGRKPPEPTDDELTFMLSFFTPKKKDFIAEDDVAAALKYWANYLEAESSITGIFSQYDSEGSAQLDVKAIAKLLADHEGSAVEENDLRQVMLEADVIGDGVIRKIEFLQFLDTWEKIKAKKKSSICTLL